MTRTVPADAADEELVRRYATDATALDELIRRYEARVRRCARRMCLNLSDAEDLVQETFLRLLLALPSYHGASSFRTWLYAIAHNTCIDACRERLKSPPTLDLETALAAAGHEPRSGVSIEDEVERQIRECYLGRAIAALPADYRAVVRLRLVEGLSTQAAAACLGATAESVKARLQRARKLLRRRLSQPSTCPLCEGLGRFAVVPAPQVRDDN